MQTNVTVQLETVARAYTALYAALNQLKLIEDGGFYPPQLDGPSERAFSKVKRSIQESARDLSNAMGDDLDKLMKPTPGDKT